MRCRQDLRMSVAQRASACGVVPAAMYLEACSSTTDSEVWTWKSISSCGCRRSNSATVRFRPSLCYLPHSQIQPHSLQHHRLFSRRTNKCPTTPFLVLNSTLPWASQPPRRPHTAFSRARIKRRQAFRFRARGAKRSSQLLTSKVDEGRAADGKATSWAILITGRCFGWCE